MAHVGEQAAAAAEPVISVHELRKTYGSTVAADSVTFEVARGEIFGIIGPNGSGKTTTVECLQGLRTPDSGSATVLGSVPWQAGSALRERIGSQLQEAALPDRIRVWEALDMFGALSNRGADWHTLVDRWGLAEKRKAAFATLSGGQRQRLFIALALVNDPEVVFLDEMTTGLDPSARRGTWELIREVRERGATVVLVSHFMDEAEQLCDRIAVFKRGRVVALDSPSQLISTHAADSTVRFTAEPGTSLGFLSEVAGVASVDTEGAGYAVRGNGPLLAHVAAALVARGIAPMDLRVERQSLEDVFLALTGEAGE